MTSISEKWLKALDENIRHVSLADVAGGEPKAIEALLRLITATERVRSLRFPGAGAKELAANAARLLKNVSWDENLKSSCQVILSRMRQDVETGIRRFSDGLENMGPDALSTMAAELILLRDELERLYQWFATNVPGSIVQGLEKSYPSDEQIRALLPDLDEYSAGLRATVRSRSKASWIWTERADCLSSAGFSQFAMGLSADPDRDRTHVKQCGICSRLMGTIDIPGLGRGEGDLPGHPDFDTLEKLHAGRISGKEREDLKAHISRCSRCRGFLGGIAAAEEDRNVVVLDRKKVPVRKGGADKEGAGGPLFQLRDNVKMSSKVATDEDVGSGWGLNKGYPDSDGLWKSDQSVWRNVAADLAAAPPSIPSMKEIVPPHRTLWDDKAFRADLFRQGKRYVFAVLAKRKGKVSAEGIDVSGKTVVVETSRMGNETTFSFSPQSYRFPLSFRIRAGGSENTFIIRE